MPAVLLPARAAIHQAVAALHSEGVLWGCPPVMDGEPLILDELLGRLAAEDPRGHAILDGPVRIQGMTPTVQAMANVVVAQRLGQVGGFAAEHLE